jgi:predicted DNA-binding protein with PD1-like motif
MQVILEDSNQYVLRFDAGEEVVARLAQFAQQHTIRAAHFTALGAAGEVVLAYYDLGEKKYEDQAIVENMEILSVVGNIGEMEGKPAIHAHGTFGRRDLSIVGGHIKKLVVSATCEVHITKLLGQLQRAYNEDTGLNLLS